MRLRRVITAIGLAGFVGLASAANTPPEKHKLNPKAAGTIPAQAIEDRHYLPVSDGSNCCGQFILWEQSVLSKSRSSVGLSANAGSSPGILICASGSLFDVQHNDDGQRQIATLGSGKLVHFTWMLGDWGCEWCLPVRLVNYNAYNSSSGLTLGDCGVTISGAGADPIQACGGFSSVDVASDDNAHVAFHQHNEESQPEPSGPYSSWVVNQSSPGLNLFNETELGGSHDPEAIWPHVAIDRGGASKAPSDDVFHVAAHASGNQTGFENEIFYWRRIGDYPNTWEGPVILDVNAGTFNHHVAVDPSSERVSVIYEVDDNPEDLLQVVYLESASNGADWIGIGGLGYPMPLTSLGLTATHVTAYDDPNGAQAWVECTGEYDLDGRLHVVWVEQKGANVSSECRLMHWDDLTGTTHIIRQAYDFVNSAGDGMRDLWLAYPQIAFGDGTTLCTDGPVNPGTAGGTSNRDYIYITYEQFGGSTPEEGNDASVPCGADPMNAEIYLSVSNNNGETWSPPSDLTNTKSAGCDGTLGNECASETFPSIAKYVNDTIHMSYILDTGPGELEYGGWFAWNFVMYYRIPGGTDAEYICPEIASHISAVLSNQQPDCEYHTGFNPPGMRFEELRIQNLGNAVLTGDITVSPPTATWLQVSTGAYSILPGNPDDVRTVTMNASDPAITVEGLYQAQIEVTHDDATQPSPIVIPVDFFVFDDFHCPQTAVLHTSRLWLEVSSTGSFANEHQRGGGMARLATDSSWSIYDGSLIIAPQPDSDTIVYRDVFGQGAGQPGYRALGDLLIDTSAYGTNSGDATAFARMTTIDSTIGIDVRYTFPQHTDSGEFVLIDYFLYNRTGSAIAGLNAGNAVDFDVVPGPEALREIQPVNQNTPHILPDWNLVYQQGVDTTGHVVSGDETATRFKAGITSIQCNTAPRAWIASNSGWLFGRPGSGFHEDYLYPEMTKTGFELFPPNNPNPEEDLHSVLVFAQNLDLSPTDTVRYTVGLVSSIQGNNDPTDLIATTKKAWRYVFGWQDVVTLDTVNQDTPKSYPYRILGVHEDGAGGGCCGCIVEKVNGPEAFTIAPGPDPCEGTIEFAGGTPCCAPYIASFRVRDLCDTYEDVVTVTIRTFEDCYCVCPFQCDYDEDIFLTALDLAGLIGVLFEGDPDIMDPGCFVPRGDFDCDGFSTALDLAGLIDHLFAGGAGPCDPCEAGCL